MLLLPDALGLFALGLYRSALLFLLSTVDLFSTSDVVLGALLEMLLSPAAEL